MGTVLMLAALLLAGEEAPEVGQAYLLSGDRVSGGLVSIDAKGVVRLRAQLLTGDVRVQPGQVRRVELSAAAAERAQAALREATEAARGSAPEIGLATRPAAVTADLKRQRLALADGSIVSGLVNALTASEVDLRDSPAGSLKVERSLVRAIVFSGFYSSDLPVRLKPDCLWFANRDELSAEVLKIEQGKASVAAFFGKATIDVANLSFVALRTDPAGADKPAERTAEVVLVNGDVLRGELGTVDDKALNIRTAWAGPLAIPREQVAWITFGIEDR